MTQAASGVRRRQREWARAHGIEVDAAGYVVDPPDNFFAPLSSETSAELAAGDGDELGGVGKPGKIQALHSSSALVCNVFEYWRHRDARPLSHALGLSDSIAKVAFERKFPTGLPGTPPNLDVVLTLTSGRAIAIESKFLEPYAAPSRASFADSYFSDRTGLWRAAGFSKCQALAEGLHQGKRVNHCLDAEQLLKHLLGLQRAGGQWSLLYLWFDVGGPAAAEHETEAKLFADVACADGIHFRGLTYQLMFRDLSRLCHGSDRAYIDYLGTRYFHGAV